MIRINSCSRGFGSVKRTNPYQYNGFPLSISLKTVNLAIQNRPFERIKISFQANLPLRCRYRFTEDDKLLFSVSLHNRWRTFLGCRIW